MRLVLPLLLFTFVTAGAVAQPAVPPIVSQVTMTTEVATGISGHQLYVIQGEGSQKTPYPAGFGPIGEEGEEESENFEGSLSPVCLAALAEAMNQCHSMSAPPLKFCHADGPILPFMGEEYPYSVEVSDQSTTSSNSQSYNLVINCNVIITCVCDEYSLSVGHQQNY